jgi:hypothetical protein
MAIILNLNRAYLVSTIVQYTISLQHVIVVVVVGRIPIISTSNHGNGNGKLNNHTYFTSRSILKH